MLELPNRLFPPALLAGLIIYAAITMIWLQPIVETRLAEKHFIPQCEANLLQAAHAAPLPNEDKYRQAQALIDAYENSPLAELPGIKESIEAARRIIEQMRPEAIRISKIDRSNICGCATDIALESLGLKMTLHVASLRTHMPNALKSIDQAILTNAGRGQCGELPF
ncbi:MAG: hypothetical protein AAFR27_11985 [Pseudomonadota bacterium]